MVSLMADAKGNYTGRRVHRVDERNRGAGVDPAGWLTVPVVAVHRAVLVEDVDATVERRVGAVSVPRVDGEEDSGCTRFEAARESRPVALGVGSDSGEQVAEPGTALEPGSGEGCGEGELFDDL